MPNLLRNVLAILAGIAIGGGVNMARSSELRQATSSFDVCRK